MLLRIGLLEDAGFVVYGNVCCESQFEDDAHRQGAGARPHTREASIAVEVDGSVLSGELHFRGDDYDFALNCASDYNRSMSLAALAGVYTRRTSSISATIDADSHDRRRRR